MPTQVQIQVPRRWWNPLRRKYRRFIASSWEEVPVERRLPLLATMVRYPGMLGRLKALQSIIRVPKHVFNNLSDSQAHALISHCSFLKSDTEPLAIFPEVEHLGKTYYMPSDYGMNLVALEYPIADEAFTEHLRTGSPASINLLCGALLRERSDDEARILRLGDPRCILESRSQAEARATELAALPLETKMLVLMYFAGVKKFVHQQYQLLFEGPKKDDEQQEELSTAPSLGWWSVYFDLGKSGPFGDVEKVYQTSFHDICIYLVDQRRKDIQDQIRNRMKSNKFGEDE